MDTPKRPEFMNAQAWEIERTTLRGRFTMGTIIKATRKELEWYLLVLANSSLIGGHANPPEVYKMETEAFTNVIRHLLQVRLGVELHRRSLWVSIFAVVISVLALGWNIWAALSNN